MKSNIKDNWQMSIHLDHHCIARVIQPNSSNNEKLHEAIAEIMYNNYKRKAAH